MPSGQGTTGASQAKPATVMLGVWLRDVLGTLDDQHGLGQDAGIRRWPIAGVGEAGVALEPLMDDFLGRAPAQDALATGVVG